MRSSSIAAVARRWHAVAVACLLGMSALQVRAQDSLSLLFTGDILLDRGVSRYLSHGGMARLIHGPVADLLKQTDIVVGNLECPATDVRQPAYKRYVFRADPRWLDSLRAVGFTHLNLANNHSVDQGREGLADTRNQIQARGLVPVGAGAAMDEAARPLLVAAQPRPVWLVASNRLPLEAFAWLPETESISQEPFQQLRQRVASLRESDSTAVIVVMLHWGAEHRPQPHPQQRAEARTLIQAGADCIIGHHPHVLQPAETILGKPVYYSLGNFIFDQEKPLNSKAAVVRMLITGEGRQVKTELLPVTIRHCAPQLDNP